MRAFARKDYAAAIAQFPLARPKSEETTFAELGDYVAYYSAASKAELRDYPAAARELEIFDKPAPLLSPLGSQAAMLAARVFLNANAPGDAIRVLRENYKILPQPEGDFALASAYQAQGELSQAAILYQRVYYLYPAKPAAADASKALEGLRHSMLKSFPPPMPQQMLERGEQWVASREYGKAHREFESLVPLLGGVESDQARVRIGAADYHSGNTRGAYAYLDHLRVPRSEADAERIYYLAECARKTNDERAMLNSVKQLETKYSESGWRLKALVSAGNYYLMLHRAGKYEPLYRAAYDTFPADAATAYCHWKVAWNAYLSRRQDAAEMLERQVTSYPFDEKAAAALYFSGRLAENRGDPAAARACYAKLTGIFPHFYYGVLARSRMAGEKSAAEAPESAAWVAKVEFPARPAAGEFASLNANPPTKLRMQRAHLLASEGFDELAEAELRFGAKNDGQPNILAMELARTAAAPHRGLRFMKTLVPDYLAIPFENAPLAFWKALFPMPFQDDLARAARQRNLDPNILAALIRQESEFNPLAVSPANAYGLTQLLPATGRDMAQRIGVRDFNTGSLLKPATNLSLGAMYLRAMLDQWSGLWEPTLASYNAGKGRVDDWLASSHYREPAEFVESIPFTETREYVQAVLRNAELYRRIYGTKLLASPATRPKPSPRLVKNLQRAHKHPHPIT
ncbi:MAG: lytic transglycosylase domain-containing protein [Acidobacteriota bacterium]|nr:lytic transglycosylase domain-containing protein [Acidobacteriota bacterium]